VLESAFSGMLGWLEYSFKRSLGIEKSTDEKEQQLGMELVRADAAFSQLEGAGPHD